MESVPEPCCHSRTGFDSLIANIGIDAILESEYALESDDNTFPAFGL
jgi:hypothetical protein